jgi:hypothetical protein
MEDVNWETDSKFRMLWKKPVLNVRFSQVVRDEKI